MRLIDADALTKEIEDFNCKDCNHYNYVRCRACQIDDALSYIDDAPTVEDTNVPSKWISVKERLPERPDWYLVYAPDYCGGSSRGKELHKGVMFAKWNGKSWGIEKGYYNRPNIVVAWREIPEPPEGVTQDG